MITNISALININESNINKSNTGQAQGINRCHLLGYVSNELSVCEQLKINFDNVKNDPQAVLQAAVKRWGHHVNQFLVGDYVLVWQAEEHLLITSSARASFTVYYQKDDAFALSSDLNTLGKTLSESQLLQNLTLGPLTTQRTCFNNVCQLQPGETLVWKTDDAAQLTHQVQLAHQAQLPKTQQVELAQLVQTPEATTLERQDVDLGELVNHLPQLAYRLGEPVTDAILAHFDQEIGACVENTVVLDAKWLAARKKHGAQPFKQNYNWCKGLLNNQLSRHKKQLKKYHDALRSEHAAAQVEQSQTFEQWIDFNYVLPAWCQLLQRIARLHGKTLVNPFIVPEQAMALVKQGEQQDDQPQGYFSLQQDSINNVFDAMQRLFHIGEPDTLTLFNLNPHATAKLVSQHASQKNANPRRIEQLCIVLLTFDYLARFNRATP
ncbi:MAG: hypothetical protein HRT35_12740 [Algicola sp.]|nr:hypothetical protein [Algicola sp.]